MIDIGSDTVSLFGNDASLEEIVWIGPQPTLAELGAQCGCYGVPPIFEARSRRLTKEPRSDEVSISFLPTGQRRS